MDQQSPGADPTGLTPYRWGFLRMSLLPSVNNADNFAPSAVLYATLQQLTAARQWPALLRAHCRDCDAPGYARNFMGSVGHVTEVAHVAAAAGWSEEELTSVEELLVAELNRGLANPSNPHGRGWPGW